MANATDLVKKGVVRWTDEFDEQSSATLSAETTFWGHAMVGFTTGGYLAKFDDTASMILAGVVRGDEGGKQVLPAGTAGDGTINLSYHQPRKMHLQITSVAVTDIGKTVYALFDNQGTTDFSATTYANVIGKIVGVYATNIAIVELAYDGVAGNARLGAAKRLAATGTSTLSKWDANKKIFCANTAAKSIVLPAVADVQAGATLAIFKDHASDANILTLDGADSEEIDAATTLTTLDAAYDVATLVCNGARWIVQCRDIA